MDYTYFQFDGLSSRNYNLIAQNKGEDLFFSSQPQFENQLVSPLYQNTNYLAGVDIKARTFSFNCWVESASLDLVRSMLDWLSVDKVGELVVDYNPNFKYNVKVQSMSDFKHFAVNEDGTGNYEFTLSFITVGDFAAVSKQTLVFDTNNYISQTPMGFNNDNGGPITFNDINYQTGLPEFKILNYYSEPINLSLNLNVPSVQNTFMVTSEAQMLALSANLFDYAYRIDLNQPFILMNLPASTINNWQPAFIEPGKFSVKVNGTEYYNYTNTTGSLLNYSLDTKNGIVLSNNTIVESIEGVEVNTNLGRMNIPSGSTQTIIDSVISFEAPYNQLLFKDTNLLLNYSVEDIASGNLYVVVQSASYGDNSTTGIDPISRTNYLYDKINKDGSNSDINKLAFNTDILSQGIIEEGEIAWNKTHGTFDMGLLNGYVLQSGEELVYFARCAVLPENYPFKGSIAAGSPVMFVGVAADQTILIAKASYAVLAEFPYFYLGIAAQDITEGDTGYVTLFGTVGGLTHQYPSGTVLYVDPFDFGKITDQQPPVPLRRIIIGASLAPDLYGLALGQIVVVTSRSSGVEDLHDIYIPEGRPVSGDALTYYTFFPGTPYEYSAWTPMPGQTAAGSMFVQDVANVFNGTNVEDVLKELYDTKVDKVPGYALISNTDLTKLAGIEEGAQVNVQADWTATSGDAFILNKPFIPAPYNLPQATITTLGGVKIDGSSIIINESGVISSTFSGGDFGTVKSIAVNAPLSITNPTVNPTISIAQVTTSTAGIMSAADKIKLNGIATGAQVNVKSDWNAVVGDAEILNKPTIPTQYTNELAQDAVGGILVDTPSINLTYTDEPTPTISASAIFGTIAGTIAEGNDPRLSDARTPISHSHGNINNLGQLGSDPNLVVITGPSGLLTTTSRSGIDSRTSFTPSAHTHSISNITDLTETLNNKAIKPTNEATAQGGQILVSNGNGTSTYQTSSAFYTLPMASSQTLGGVKVGAGLSIDISGALNWTPGDNGLFLMADGSRVADYLDVTGQVTAATFEGIFNLNDAGGYFTSNDIEGALQEVGLALNDAALADNTTIIDAGSYFTSTNVEGALQEVGLSLDNIYSDYQLRSEKGQPNGYASLDVDGKVPAAQLPSYVDDVLEYANLASFPAIGETGKIYVDLATNKTYRWGGSSYAEISASLALGETSSTAYHGDRGKIAYDHTGATGNMHGVTLSTLTDTTITSNTSGEILKWNGSAWINNTLAEAGIQPAGTYVTSVSGTAPIVSSGGTTPAISMAAATASVNGYMTSTYAAKLDGIEAGAQVNVGTNLTYTTAASSGQINSSTGTPVTLPAATTSLAGLLTGTDKTKLNGIATGAEVNQNAFSNIAVSGQTTVAADTKTDTLTLVGGNNVTITTDAASDSVTINAFNSTAMSIFTEEFTATASQTLFTLTTGSYSPGNDRLAVYIWGLRQPDSAFTETSATSFTLAAGVEAGTKVLAEWRVADPTIKGDKGDAATVTLGTVTTRAVGTGATVTNTGTSDAAIFNFGIPVGATGATGAAATIAVGTTTTGAAGSSATVSNSGTSAAAVFNFTIPRGDTGTAATVAVGTTTTGDAGTNASVTNSGNSSAAVFNFTIPRGNTGATGAAATIAVGTVTTLAPGSAATVTNAGTSGAAVFNFGIPQGAAGASAANAVTVADAGAYYTGTNVEAVLQEIGVALSNASGAAVDISITDTGAYYTSGNVEGALQEVGLSLDGAVYTSAAVLGTDVYASAATVNINDAGNYYVSTTVEDALQEIGLDFDTLNANKIDKYYPTIIGATTIEAPEQYHVLKVKSTHTSAIPILQMRDGNETGFDIAYEKTNASLVINKTVAGAYDSTLLVLHSDFISYKGNSVWHAANDGSTSGLDADLLDGQHGSYYAPLANPTFTGTLTAPTINASTALQIGGVAITATAAELNYVDGVTSNIQTQLNAKAPLAAPALTGAATLDSRRIISNSASTGTAVYQIWSGTQAQYDAIGTKDANTLYFIA